MPFKKAGRKKRKKHPWEILWSRFLWERSGKSIDVVHLLMVNSVSLSIPAPCTHRDVVERVASCAATPILIESLSDNLHTHKLVRGQVCLGYAGDLFNQIATNYPTMRWWVAEQGLNMDIVAPDPVLSSFDALAGKLTAASWQNGRLSKVSLLEIAKELDTHKYSLRKELQPKHWRGIANYNQKFSREPITTFERAARNPSFVRGVRRRL